MRKELTLTISLLLGGIFITPAFSQDKATLDLLVKKGVITQSEADQVAKQSSLVIRPKSKDTKAMTISGYVQTQFDYVDVNNNLSNSTHPNTTQEFLIRRAVLSVAGDLGAGVTGTLAMDFAAGAGSYQATSTQGSRQLFDTVLINKKFKDVGAIEAGYRKVYFAEEFVSPASAIPTVELSAATQYFTSVTTNTASGNAGVGGRHVGVFWQGETPVKGLIYRAAVTNGQQTVTGYTNGGNLFSYWGSAAYTGKVKAVDYTTGLNVVYSQNANTVYATPSNYTYGLNPYIAAKWGKVGLHTEFLWSYVQNGDAPSGNAQPLGVNFTPTYRFTDQWEAALRFSYLTTDGRGVGTNSVYDAPSSGTLFDSVYSIYAGVNWYIIGNSLKVMLGYEYLKYEGAQLAGGGTADDNALRLRVQLMF